MDCHLCGKPIAGYDVKFHRLVIDDSHEFDVCTDCSGKFMKWQGKVFSVLFPTSAMKNRFNKEK
jgi:ribosome-binding protein aMBF1 (putative translation factor)